MLFACFLRGPLGFKKRREKNVSFVEKGFRVNEQLYAPLRDSLLLKIETV